MKFKWNFCITGLLRCFLNERWDIAQASYHRHKPHPQALIVYVVHYSNQLKTVLADQPAMFALCPAQCFLLNQQFKPLHEPQGLVSTGLVD